MWRSVFLHEFTDTVDNFQALPGRLLPPSLTLKPSDDLTPGTNSVAISPGAGLDYQLDAPLTDIVGISIRAQLIYPLNPQPRRITVARLGPTAELAFWPAAQPLPDQSGTLATADVVVAQELQHLGQVVLPANQFVEIRVDWHASGQVRILVDGKLVGYHNLLAPGAVLSIDNVVFGMGDAQPPSPQPLYHLSRVFVRVLARPDAMAHLSKLLPKVELADATTDCQHLIVENALAAVDRLRVFMADVHQDLSQPWSAQDGPASGPFQPQAIEAHTLATASAAAFVDMLKTGDFRLL